MTRSPCLLLEQHKKPTATPPTVRVLSGSRSPWFSSPVALYSSPPSLSHPSCLCCFFTLSFHPVPPPSLPISLSHDAAHPYRGSFHTNTFSPLSSAIWLCVQRATRPAASGEAGMKTRRVAWSASPLEGERDCLQELSASLCHFSQRKTCLLEKIAFILEAE